MYKGRQHIEHNYRNKDKINLVMLKKYVVSTISKNVWTVTRL